MYLEDHTLFMKNILFYIFFRLILGNVNYLGIINFSI